MSDRTILLRLGKLVSAEISSGSPGLNCKAATHYLDGRPGSVLDLIDMIAREAARKRPNEKLLPAFLFLAGRLLEQIRDRAGKGDSRSISLADSARQALNRLVSSGRITAPVLHLILQEFPAVALQAGETPSGGTSSSEAPRGGTPRMTEPEEVEAEPAVVEDFDATLQAAIEAAGVDPFDIHTELIQLAESMPEERRSALAAAMLRSTEPVLREAALGALFDDAAPVRTKTAGALAQIASRGGVSGTMLRRIETLRNWLPESECPSLDPAIEACHRKGIKVEPWPSPQLVEVLAVACDGTGEHSLFVVVKEGRKSGLGCVLIDEQVGIADAWARHAMSRREPDDFLGEAEKDIDLYPVPLDYIRIAAGHFLSVNLVTGVMPPFALLDFAETAGLSELRPQALPLDNLLGRIEGEIDPVRLEPKRIASELGHGESLADSYPVLQTWFEDDEETTALLKASRAPKAKPIGLVRDQILEARREKWATRLAWMALMLQHVDSKDSRWEEFFLAAREVSRGRPLNEISLMTLIAARSVEVFTDKHRARSRRK
jgi:hypothetical protein